jgi:GT2 family glycosyltransferase
MTVSVIVLNFNGMTNQYLATCLESLRKQSFPSLQLIVVDNASRDESRSYLKGCTDVHFVTTDKPLGFGAANNLGYAHATGDYVLFANNDTVFETDCVQQLVTAANLAPDIGMVAPKLLRPRQGTDSIRLIDSAGTLLRRELTMYDRGWEAPDRGQFDAPAIIFAPTGAAAFFRRPALETVRYEDGMLWDEDFYFYYEDGDLGWRVRNAGWRCLYYPAAVVEHYRGATMPPKFFSKTHAFKVHTIKNRYLMILKNAPARMLIKNLPVLLAREVLILGYMLLHPRLLGDVWRALGGSMSRALQKRRRSSLSNGTTGLFAAELFQETRTKPTAGP